MSNIDLLEEIVMSGRYDDVGIDYANIFVSKADILKEAIPLLKELSNLHKEKANKNMKETTVKGFLDYLESLTEKEDI